MAVNAVEEAAERDALAQLGMTGKVGDLPLDVRRLALALVELQRQLAESRAAAPPVPLQTRVRDSFRRLIIAWR